MWLSDVVWCHQVTKWKAGQLTRCSGAVFSVGERSFFDLFNSEVLFPCTITSLSQWRTGKQMKKHISSSSWSIFLSSRYLWIKLQRFGVTLSQCHSALGWTVPLNRCYGPDTCSVIHPCFSWLIFDMCRRCFSTDKINNVLSKCTQQHLVSVSHSIELKLSCSINSSR